VGDEVERVGEFWRDGEQKNVAARGLLQAVEEFDGGRL
jgi:hypothetical protein